MKKPADPVELIRSLNPITNDDSDAAPSDQSFTEILKMASSSEPQAAKTQPQRRLLLVAAAVTATVGAAVGVLTLWPGSDTNVTVIADDSSTASTTTAFVETSTTTSGPIDTTPTTQPTSTSEQEQSTNTKADRTAQATELAEALGADRMVVTDDSNIYVWADGVMTTLGLGEDDLVTADQNFVYRAVPVPGIEEEYVAVTVVRTYSGDAVCKLIEFVDHVTEREDGTYVAGVQRDIEEEDRNTVGAGYPMFAVDCASGQEQAIASISFVNGEVETLSIERVGGRTFEIHWDAEGNVDVLNESGLSINGDDYAGYQSFNADGSRVAYGEMRDLIHASRTVISRDTTTGEELWRSDVEIPFFYLGFVGNNVIASRPTVFDSTFQEPTASVVVLDGDTGEVLETIPTTLTIIFAS